MFIKRNNMIMAAAILMILGFTLGMWYQSLRSVSPDESGLVLMENMVDALPNDELPQEPEYLQVYVAGAVSHPGVYSMPTGSRVHEALELAGLLENAEIVGLPMARLIKDEETVLVPYHSEAGPEMSEAQALNQAIKEQEQLSDSRGLVNINTATLNELQQLPGIGPVLAQRIIDYRIRQGGFGDITELRQVSGIGDKRYTDIADLITVR